MYPAVDQTVVVPLSDIHAIDRVAISNGLRKFEYPVVHLKNHRNIKLRVFIDPPVPSANTLKPSSSYTEMLQLVSDIRAHIGRVGITLTETRSLIPKWKSSLSSRPSSSEGDSEGLRMRNRHIQGSGRDLSSARAWRRDAVLAYVEARRSYYACYEPTTMVHDLVAHYSADQSRIPKYDLILVDEYQDFNKLEMELIDLLSLKSHILIAGDDDQSLYSFKHAAPDHIRELSASGRCELFELPYCSRSTEVVISAFHDFLTKAGAEGHLQERIDKKYLYFPCEKKDKVSTANPNVEVLTDLLRFKLLTTSMRIFRRSSKRIRVRRLSGVSIETAAGSACSSSQEIGLSQCAIRGRFVQRGEGASEGIEIFGGGQGFESRLALVR